MAAAPLAGAHSPAPVFLDGILRSTIDWEALGGDTPDNAAALRDYLGSASILDFPPSSYLRAAVLVAALPVALSTAFAQQYGGKCNLRFDDTNPLKEEQEYIDSIKADINWLGFHWKGREKYTSDYFDQLYEWAVKLVRAGKAYVCDLSAEQIRDAFQRRIDPERMVTVQVGQL